MFKDIYKWDLLPLTLILTLPETKTQSQPSLLPFFTRDIIVGEILARVNIESPTTQMKQNALK